MRRITCQLKNGQKVLTHTFAAQGGKRLADQHHVGFGHAHVERAALVHGRHAGFEAAG